MKHILVLLLLLVSSCTPRDTTTTVPQGSSGPAPSESSTEDTASEAFVPETGTPIIIGSYQLDYWEESYFRQFGDLQLIIGPGDCENFAGIEQFTDLKFLTLYFRADTVPDFSPLRSLHGLRGISIIGDISTIPDLGMLPALETLKFSETRIASLDGLEKAVRLKTLSIYTNSVPITGSSSLRHLESLRTITFYNTFLNIDMADLAENSNLEELYLGGLGAVDMAGIGGIRSLRKLYLYSNISRDFPDRTSYLHIEEIGRLTDLRELQLDETLDRIDFLAGNTNLENLALFNDREREDFGEEETMVPLDLAPLASLKKLKYLAIGGFIPVHIEMLRSELPEAWIDTERFGH